MSVNPNAPTLLGYEPMIRYGRGLRITKDRKRMAVLTPGAVLTDDVALRFRDVQNPTYIAVELMKVSDMTPAGGVPTVTTILPSGDFVMGGAAHAGGGTAPPFYVDVDEGAVDNPADYIINQGAANVVWGMQYAAGGFAAGRRVLKVEHKFYASGGSGFGSTLVNPWFYNGSYWYPSQTGGFYVGGSGPGLYIVEMDVNPSNGLPWTVADIVALAAGSSEAMGFDIFAPAVNTFKLYDDWLDVTWVPETRLAFGNAQVNADGWAVVGMATPTGTDTWTPVAATPYGVIVRVVADGFGNAGAVTWEAIDAGIAHPDIYSALVVSDANGFPVGVGTADTAAPGVVGVDAAGTTSLWGQPFYAPVEEPVYSGRTVEKEVTLPNTDDRGSVKLIVRQQSRLTSAPLIVRLRLRAGGAQVGGDVVFTPNEVRDAPLLDQVVVLPMVTKATGPTAAQHYLECSCVGASGEGWIVLMVTAGTAGYAAIGRANNADLVTVGGVDAPEREMPITLAKARAAPTSLTAVAAT